MVLVSMVIASCTTNDVTHRSTTATYVMPPVTGGGEPIRIGWFDANPSDTSVLPTSSSTGSSTGSSSTSSSSIELPGPTRAAQAAVSYVNASFGGVAGRPLVLVACVSDNSDRSTDGCASRLLDGKPDVVLKGVDSHGSAALGVVAGAGLSYATVQAISTPELTSRDSVVFTPGTVGYFAAAAQFAADNHWKRVGLLLTETAPAAQAFQAFGLPVFQRLGITVVGAPAPSEPTRLSSMVAAATASAVDGLVVIASDGCTDVLKALHKANYHGPIMLTAACAVPDVLSDPLVDGAYFLYPDVSADGADPDTVQYREAMARYAPGVDIGGETPQGFSAVMDLYRALLTAPVPSILDGASLTSTLRRARNVSLFMGGGATFTCDGSALAVLSAVCSGLTAISRYQAGVWQPVRTYDANQIIGS
jgi:branched-chain amino acid transport system substrate-binding protein